MAEEYGIKVYNKNFEVAESSDIIFLSVKPGNLGEILADIAPNISPGTDSKLIVSVVAGKTTTFIRDTLAENGLSAAVPVIRTMPNTPALVGQGAIGIYYDHGIPEEKLILVRMVLSSIGTVVEIKDEALLNAVTGLSGSGPAYVFLFMQAMVKAGVNAGLCEDDARVLALKTTLGAAELATRSEKSLQELIDMVTSPGGTTVEGLKALRAADFEGTINEAVKAATERSIELSAGKK
ncbi:Pyrroline-5-carboxylate reductase [hydrothermal vent metagenome]|uniref:Pyrroline-5-carboxylate reductase n=1 Tax=hydrothermal vent metagenome TaxID=652676 RepID=A0A3B0RA46_9ZZZZ